MSDKTDLLAAFSKATRPTAPAAPAPAPRAVRARAPRLPRQETPPPTTAAARPGAPRKNLVYRTGRANWTRIKQLALSDEVSVQELIHTALSREFERRGLPALED
jgi:hypothetical protein